MDAAGSYIRIDLVGRYEETPWWSALRDERNLNGQVSLETMMAIPEPGIEMIVHYHDTSITQPEN